MRKQSIFAVCITLLLMVAVFAIVSARISVSEDGQKTPEPTAQAETASVPEKEPASSPEAEHQNSNLQKVLEEQISYDSYDWDIYMESLSTGEYAHVLRNSAPDGKMVSASIIKLFVMGAVYDEIQKGNLNHDDVYGSLTTMITWSDNDACNRLVTFLGNGSASDGQKKVNAWATSIGCGNCTINRMMLEENGLQNYVTAKDCATILRLIYRGECVSPDASKEMLNLLEKQEVNNRIPMGLPEGTLVAHKTGDLPGIANADVGIVFSPGGAYIICAICNNPQNDTAAAERIISISNVVYAYYNS